MAARHSIGIDHPTVVPNPEPPGVTTPERTGTDGANGGGGADDGNGADDFEDSE
ncbi:hypothetical protein [Salinigranum sp. GCM10025319]|uniref:hypothetical protein n=1 Tax=Salinigranum sp. GCM10025319 TaxID=3252687 RepID=UPI00360796E6